MSHKIIYIVILVIFIVLQVVTSNYSDDVSLFPRIILTIGMALCILKLLGMFIPKIGQKIDPEGMFDIASKEIKDAQAKAGELKEQEVEIGSDDSVSAASQISHKERFKREVTMVGWCISSVIAIYFVGYYVAAPLMIFFYMKFISKRPWLPSIIICSVIPCVFYFGFYLGLKVSLYTGILFN